MSRQALGRRESQMLHEVAVLAVPQDVRPCREVHTLFMLSVITRRGMPRGTRIPEHPMNRFSCLAFVKNSM
jgi:hypothetical protein